MILKNTFPNMNSQDTNYENIFETYVHWNELPNLNGLIYAMYMMNQLKIIIENEVENIVTNYINSLY
ncbi:hypothetical protein HYD96_00905 [Mycoplasmopsis bovis]|nr:hypothetical protein [Mycoplasmopsis bovis]QQH34612.1 hypothetical protein HYD96_00905 [Mycoplasmopsis bovis]